VVDTDVALIADGHLYLRGVHATELAAAAAAAPGRGFEHAAWWLWTGESRSEPCIAPPAALTAARGAVAALPPLADLTGRLRVAVAAAGAVDPLRYDVRPGAVLPTAQALLATMVDALPLAGRAPARDAGLTRRLWARLSPHRPTERLLGSLDAALVLLMDHDLAVSTVAVLTAASVRANPYAVVSTGLSAMEGPLHGAASTLARVLLRDAVARDPRLVVAEHLRTDRPLPGFGHRAYPSGDPRAAALLGRLREEPKAREALKAADALAQASGLPPNVDLALAVLGEVAGMPDDGGEVVFSVARSVGWIAHALEEYDEAPLRFRGEGRYRGLRPPQSVPSFG
jgi:citrate synthase